MEGRFCVACGKPMPVLEEMPGPEASAPPQASVGSSPSREAGVVRGSPEAGAPALVPPRSSAARRAAVLGLLARVPVALAMILTLVQSFYYFVAFIGLDSKVYVPHTYPGVPAAPPGYFDLQGLGQRTVIRIYESPLNGVCVVGFLVMALATLLLFNRLLRRRDGTGPVDRALVAVAGHRGQFGRLSSFLVPVVVVLAMLGWGVHIVATPTRFHLDASAAIKGFEADQVHGWDLAQTGPFVFGQGATGAVQIAVLTPSLVREMNRHGVQIGGREGPREYQIPGLLPLALMAALSLVGFSRWRSPTRHHDVERSAGLRARVLAAFGIRHLYVVAWLVSAQAGALDRDGRADLLWIVHLLPFVVASMAVLAVIHHKLENLDLPRAATQGWAGLFFLVSTAMPAGNYWLANAAVGSPAALWVCVYTELSALVWLFAGSWPLASSAEPHP